MATLFHPNTLSSSVLNGISAQVPSEKICQMSSIGLSIFFRARYANLSVFAKRTRIKTKTVHTSSYKADFSLVISTNTRHFCVKRKRRGKSENGVTLSPFYNAKCNKPHKTKWGLLRFSTLVAFIATLSSVGRGGKQSFLHAATAGVLRNAGGSRRGGRVSAACRLRQFCGRPGTGRPRCLPCGRPFVGRGCRMRGWHPSM